MDVGVFMGSGPGLVGKTVEIEGIGQVGVSPNAIDKYIFPARELPYSSRGRPVFREVPRPASFPISGIECAEYHRVDPPIRIVAPGYPSRGQQKHSKTLAVVFVRHPHPLGGAFRLARDHKTSHKNQTDDDSQPYNPTNLNPIHPTPPVQPCPIQLLLRIKFFLLDGC